MTPPPQAKYCPKNKLNNQRHQRIAQCLSVTVHTAWAGYWAGLGIPRVSRPWAGRQFVCRVARISVLAIGKPKARFT